MVSRSFPLACPTIIHNRAYCRYSLTWARLRVNLVTFCLITCPAPPGYFYQSSLINAVSRVLFVPDALPLPCLWHGLRSALHSCSDLYTVPSMCPLYPPVVYPHFTRPTYPRSAPTAINHPPDHHKVTQAVLVPYAPPNSSPLCTARLGPPPVSHYNQ